MNNYGNINHVWGDFLSKHPDEAMEFLNYVAETSKGWDESNLRELERMRPTANPRGGIMHCQKIWK